MSGEAAKSTGPTSSAEVSAIQSRTLRVLVASQALGGVGVAGVLAVGSALAEDVSGSTALAGLAGTANVLGAAAAALPLARLTARRGRRHGLAIGWALAACGAAIMVLAAMVRGFPLLLLGAALFGCGTAANLQARFAATDLATAARRGLALSIVVWATTVGAVAGPSLTVPATRIAAHLGIPVLAGPVLFSFVALTLGAAIITLLLRPDPLMLARRLMGEGGATGPSSLPRLGPALRAVAASPRAALGLTAVVTGHMVMVAVMTMTPVHIMHGGDELHVVGLVISLHLVGMYALSPLVGWLSDAAGRVPAILAGVAVLLLALAVSGTAGHETPRLVAGLFLLGVGWSFTLIAGSTLLSESVPAAERPAVQGSSDLMMNAFAALGGVGSGIALSSIGFGGLNMLAAVLLIPVLLLCAAGRRRSRAPNRSQV